jgi:hypothetical protein
MNMAQKQISDDLSDINTRLHALETLLSSSNTAPDVRDRALITLKNLLDELDKMLEEAPLDRL